MERVDLGHMDFRVEYDRHVKGSAGKYYQAMWCNQQFFGDIKGCPLGTGSSERKAAEDLIYRTNMESGTAYTLDD